MSTCPQTPQGGEISEGVKNVLVAVLSLCDRHGTIEPIFNPTYPVFQSLYINLYRFDTPFEESELIHCSR